ncbi:hypothetical protein [Rhodopirellula sp. MGV]|uniref:hypothetical protein n=1 Tax=Rhodopirellula sp. MGV TaxID=2023130 RepID=UPI00117AB6B8|nr:hypothetical protein [Rhodopirellula sp. MGV]
MFALVFNERSWQEYADYYGPGYHRLVGLLTEFPVPMFLGGIAGAVAGYFLFLAIYSNRGFQSRTLAGGVVAGAVVANMIAMAVYSSELFASRSRGEPAYADDVLRGVIWLIMHPTPHGAWMGAILAWAIASAFARQRVGPKTGAIGSSIFAAVLSTIAMVVIMSLTAPPGNYHGGTGMGPRESHGLIFIFIHLVFVLPISMIVGAVLGWRTHQGPR